MRLKPMGPLIQLRNYQTDLVNSTYALWAEAPNVLAVLPTGGGKTWTLTYIVNDCIQYGQRVIIFAHRDHLCEQISLTLAKAGIRHEFLVANPTRTHITNQHIEELGESFYDSHNPEPSVVVASVDTFNAQMKRGVLPAYCNDVALAVIDEAHHTIGTTKAGPANKWGRCVEYLEQHTPTLKVLGVTATPERADKKGLGRSSHGIFDRMAVGVNMAWLIEHGQLTPYRVIAPPLAQQVREAAKKARTTASGDFSDKVAESLVDTKQITGDVVQTYLKHTAGRLQGITFAASIDHANKLSTAYNAAGVTAAVLSSYLKNAERKKIMRDFRKGDLMQLVNVDIASEGFDVPGVCCVSFVRPTMSYGLFVQQWGRALRLLDGKTEALIFDHVANVYEHKLPDNGKAWTLAAPVKRKKKTESDYQLKTCGNADCMTVYELPAACCPVCMWSPTPTESREYKEVDGELVELTEEDLSGLQRELHKVNLSTESYEQWAMANAPHRAAAFAMVKKHKAIQDTQAGLRLRLHNYWLATDLHAMPEALAREQFSRIFGISVSEAMTLKTADAEKLQKRVEVLL